MNYTSFLNDHLVPTLESELNTKSTMPTHVLFLAEKKENQEKSIRDKIDKYEDSDNNIAYIDMKIDLPYDLNTNDHIIKKTSRLLSATVLITANINRQPYKEQMNDFYTAFENKTDASILNNEVIISIEAYEKNERFLYKLEGRQLVLKETLVPLERTYLPYLN